MIWSTKFLGEVCRKLLAPAIASIAMIGGASVPGHAGILLQGTDAWEFHNDTTYASQVAGFLGSNIAFINDYGVSGPSVVAGVNVTGFSSVPTSLAGFTGVEFASPSSCCSDPATDSSLGIGSSAALLTSYLASGGNISIQNFWGDPAWAAILGFDPTAGIASGVGGIIGDDPGLSTAAGIAAGFTGSQAPGTYIEYEFVHQAYDPAFFASHGFTTLITDGNTGSSYFGDAALLESGMSTVPLPTSLPMFGGALLCLAALGRVMQTKRSRQADRA